jgi:hypothetical protein
VAKPGAILALTTNLVGHWRELYEEFASALSALGLVLRGVDAEAVVAELAKALDERADLLGKLELTVPMAYVEARRG